MKSGDQVRKDPLPSRQLRQEEGKELPFLDVRKDPLPSRQLRPRGRARDTRGSSPKGPAAEQAVETTNTPCRWGRRRGPKGPVAEQAVET